MDRQQAISYLINNPIGYARMLGFDKLSALHNTWIRNMVLGRGDETLQASRGTYKTTCVSISLALIIILLPRQRSMFMRKTDNDVKEVIRQVQKILEDPHTQYFVQAIYGVNLRLTVRSATEVNTNLVADIKGTSQLIGIGLGSSLTGKHFDRIFTDDIVNVSDRISKAERERTKLIYQELQNIKNPTDVARIFNTGTPWHEEDAFSIMPKPTRYDCYHPEVKNIITDEELADRKSKMLPSLFAANYELRFIPSEEVIFSNPVTGGDPAMCEQGKMHLDSAFYGEDYTAWSVMNYHDGKYYLYGKARRKHVDECYSEIVADYERLLCGRLYNESNADKGMVGKELRNLGVKVKMYHEDMNKYLKIVTWLKSIWNDLIFVEGTDDAYIQQICDFYEDAEHDDAPDSAASLAREFRRKGNKRNTDYKPLWN